MQIGDTIRVQVRKKDDWYFAKTPYRIDTYEGTVVKQQPWAPEDTFDLLTGNPQYPVSTIANKYVVSVEVIGRSKLMPRSNVKAIIVETDAGKRHRVELFNTGLAKCDCVGFGYRRKCSHQADALAWLITKYGTDWKRVVFK